MFLVAAAPGTLPYRYSQDELCTWYTQQARGILDAAWLREVFANTRVQHRNFTLPLSDVATPRDFGARNTLYIQLAPEFLASAVRAVCQKAHGELSQLQALTTITSTGFLTPSIAARLVDYMDLAADTLHLPIIGLGCAGGVSGLAHSINWMRGHNVKVGIATAIELSTLTYQPDVIDKKSAIAAALFGDGVAAVLCRSDVAQGWEYIDSASCLRPRSQYLMGWDMTAQGYGLILSEEVPDVVPQMAPVHLAKFLARHHLTQAEIAHWILHPGGPKILNALSESTGLTGTPIDVSFHGLAQHGNMSSCSVLYSLADFLDRPAAHGDWACMVSFGPGFAMEMLLLRYRA